MSFHPPVTTLAITAACSLATMTIMIENKVGHAADSIWPDMTKPFNTFFIGSVLGIIASIWFLANAIDKTHLIEDEKKR